MYPPPSTISVHSASHPTADQRVLPKTNLPVGLIIILPASTPAIPGVRTPPTDASDTIRSSRLTRPSILTSVVSSGANPPFQLWPVLYWPSPVPLFHVNGFGTIGSAELVTVVNPGSSSVAPATKTISIVPPGASKLPSATSVSN